MSSHATLSAATDNRKARLAKLRSIKRKQPDDEVVPPESERTPPTVARIESDAGKGDGPSEPDVSRLHLSGRNYDPELRGAKLGFELPPNLAVGPGTLEAKASELVAGVRQQQEDDNEFGRQDVNDPEGKNKAVDLFKLQPKKPNWDLKRELNKRLEPINVRTDNAIARLVRERLAAKTLPNSQSSTQERASWGSNREMAEDQGGLEGAVLVESLRVREQEQRDEERREREADENV